LEPLLVRFAPDLALSLAPYPCCIRLRFPADLAGFRLCALPDSSALSLNPGIALHGGAFGLMAQLFSLGQSARGDLHSGLRSPAAQLVGHAPRFFELILDRGGGCGVVHVRAHSEHCVMRQSVGDAGLLKRHKGGPAAALQLWPP
jgi:hypothetical protein